MSTPHTFKHAILSPCERYRYSLIRDWSGGGGRGQVCFVGLNPSTADADQDDPTIRRCVGFAKSWGFDSLRMVNLFAFRSTKPGVLASVRDPVGPDNDQHLRLAEQMCGLVVAAWGASVGGLLDRDTEVVRMFQSMSVLRLTKHNHPSHPLYLPANLTPTLWFTRPTPKPDRTVVSALSSVG
jgi:hypothetical protein